MKTLRLFFALAAVAALAACGSDPVATPGPDLKPSHGVSAPPSPDPVEPVSCTTNTTCAVMGSGN